MLRGAALYAAALPVCPGRARNLVQFYQAPGAVCNLLAVFIQVGRQSTMVVRRGVRVFIWFLLLLGFFH